MKAVLAANRFGDRFEKIGQILALAGGPADPAEVRRLADAYNAICEEAQATCAEREGAGAALAALSKRFPLYVNSATPEEPLVRIVRRRGWSGLFKGVLGRPATKVENLRSIAAVEKAGADEVLFVGDMSQDLEAAEAFGCRFAGLKSPESDLGGTRARLVDSLREVERLLTEK